MEIVREMVKKMGIRPLSNSIGVNSKTVYKYNLGEAVPREETLGRLLDLLREKDPEMFWGYMKKLREGFEEALSSLQQEEREGVSGDLSSPPVEEGFSEGREVSRFEVYRALGIENPSERVRLARILGLLSSAEEFGVNEVTEKTMLSREEVEDYLEKMAQRGLLERSGKGVYRVRVKCKL